jgi:hypothetical protein
MNRSVLFTFAAAAAALVMSSSADAQRPLSLSLAGGASLPTGRLGDDADVGWHALAAIGLSTYMQPIGLRLDVAFNRFSPATAGLESFDVGSATLNLTYRLPMTNSPVSPYLISGAGAYRSARAASVGGESATTRYGWNAGLGIKLYALGLRSFIEARYHRTKRGGETLQYFPATFGLTF